MRRYNVGGGIAGNGKSLSLAFVRAARHSEVVLAHFPVPVGVIFDVKRATHDELLTAQREEAVAKRGSGDLRALLEGGETWVVPA